jgi:hypothetical protein
MMGAMSKGYGWVQRKILEVIEAHRPHVKTWADLQSTEAITATVFGVDPHPDFCWGSGCTEAQKESVKRALRALRRDGRVGFVQPSMMFRNWYIPPRPPDAASHHP